MPRAPVAGLFGLVLGTLFLGLGLALLAWVLMTNIKVAWGFDWAMWVAQVAPREWNLDPATFGNQAINRKIPVALAAGCATVIGLALVFGARRRLRPIDVSDTGRGRIAFRATPRVGECLQGSIYLLGGGAEPGAMYELQLECFRDVSDSVEKPYLQDRAVRAVMGGQGLHLPFSFDVPITAPPTFGATGLFGGPGRHAWRLHFGEQGKWLQDTFVLQMEPPLADAAGIRIQRLAWKVISWAILAYVVVFHAAPFLANEFWGR